MVVEVLKNKYNMYDEVYVVSRQNVMDTRMTCGLCKGTGKLSYREERYKCPRCLGTGVYERYITKHQVFKAYIVGISIDKHRIQYTVNFGKYSSIRNEDYVLATKEEAEKVRDQILKDIEEANNES